MRFVRGFLTLLLAAWVCFVALIYHQMLQPPEVFASFMAKMPGWVFLVLPFETLWTLAQAGNASVDTMAPDFTLTPLRGGPPVHLASLRGVRPVVLVFGSYT
jgi:hypothetical protein